MPELLAAIYGQTDQTSMEKTCLHGGNYQLHGENAVDTAT